MPEYIIDGVVHFKYKIHIKASTAEEAKQEIKRLTLSELEINNVGKTGFTNEINPTVEVIG